VVLIDAHEPIDHSAREQSHLMIFIDQDLIPKKDRGAYNHV
jgi:hypothetical protein